MNFDDKTYKTMEDYLHNRLSESDKVAFENLMKDDANLYQEVQELKELTSLLGEEGISNDYEILDKNIQDQYVNYFESEDNKNLSKLLENVSASQKKTRKVISINRKPFFYKLIAATLVLAICIPLLIKITSPSPNKLYSANFTIENIEWSEKGKEDKLRSSIEESFNAKEYAAANDKLRELINLNTNNYEAIYYLAICYQKLEDFENAKAEYQKIISSNSLLKNDTYWNLSLIELKDKNYTSALENLSNISDDNKYNQRKSKLEKRLKKLLNK